MLGYIEKYGTNVILESLMKAVKRVRDRPYSSSHQHSIMMIIIKLNCTVQPADTKFYLLALETDIPFTTDGATANFRGTFTTGSAKKLAACLMGGYKALHSAQHKCLCRMANWQ